MPFVDGRGFSEYINSGHESDVFGRKRKDFVHKQRFPEEQIYEWESSPNYIKAEFYLTKLAHLLFPKNIPDLVAAGKFSQIQERKTVDDDTIDKAKIIELRNNLHQTLDVKLDSNNANFLSHSGDVVYVDRLSPWYVYQPPQDDSSPKKIWMRFSEEKIKSTIDNLPEKKLKDKAKKYLENIKLFLQAEKQRLGGVEAIPFPFNLNRLELPN